MKKLVELINKGEELKSDIKGFSSLTMNQFNWKPSAEAWSVGQCIDHIIETNNRYMPTLQLLANNQYTQTFWQKISPFTGAIGKSMVSTLGPNVKKKFKSPAIFKPTMSNIELSILEDFIAHQNSLLELFHKVEHHDMKNTVISSPVSPMITINLGDALAMLVDHEQRHVQQAKNLVELSGFGGLAAK